MPPFRTGERRKATLSQDNVGSGDTSEHHPASRRGYPACGTIGLVNLLEKLKRWWAPGEYDDERPPSDGEDYALSDREYEEHAEQPTKPIVERGSKH